MNKPCTTWLIFCLLGILSIPIIGCGGGSMAASTPQVAGTPSITWNPPATMQYGSPLSDVELNATASVPVTLSTHPPPARSSRQDPRSSP